MGLFDAGFTDYPIFLDQYMRNPEGLQQNSLSMLSLYRYEVANNAQKDCEPTHENKLNKKLLLLEDI